MGAVVDLTDKVVLRDDHFVVDHVGREVLEQLSLCLRQVPHDVETSDGERAGASHFAGENPAPYPLHPFRRDILRVTEEAGGPVLVHGVGRDVGIAFHISKRASVTMSSMLTWRLPS